MERSRKLVVRLTPGEWTSMLRSAVIEGGDISPLEAQMIEKVGIVEMITVDAKDGEEWSVFHPSLDEGILYHVRITAEMEE